MIKLSQTIPSVIFINPFSIERERDRSSPDFQSKEAKSIIRINILDRNIGSLFSTPRSMFLAEESESSGHFSGPHTDELNEGSEEDSTTSTDSILRYRGEFSEEIFDVSKRQHNEYLTPDSLSNQLDPTYHNERPSVSSSLTEPFDEIGLTGHLAYSDLDGPSSDHVEPNNFSPARDMNSEGLLDKGERYTSTPDKRGQDGEFPAVSSPRPPSIKGTHELDRISSGQIDGSMTKSSDFTSNSVVSGEIWIDPYSLKDWIDDYFNSLSSLSIHSRFEGPSTF